MKLSSVAVLLSAAAVALPGASAATVSLRGILPEVEELAAFANCDTKEDCPKYGRNSCDTIEKDCNGQCYWDGSGCAYGGRRSCSSYNNRSSCEDANCDWNSSRNQCRTPTVSFRCSDYNNNRNQCTNEGCSWVRSRCVIICSDFDNKGANTCEQNGLCTYNSRNGHCDISKCSDLDNTSLTECEDNTENICSWNQSRRECSFSNSEEVEEVEENEEEEEVEEEEDVEAEE
mmetsp:Transcript_3005/g.4304  ORF Transcript_3005/g.4304 Transcript_3005/m.4304 type:complete len:231 (-) Transcript_3005:117-809(-)